MIPLTRFLAALIDVHLTIIPKRQIVKKMIIWGIVCLVCILPQFLPAQTIYGKAGAAYRFGYPYTYIAKSFNSNQVYLGPGLSDYSEDTRGVYGTFGKGIAVEGALGIKGEHLGAEIGISYLFRSSTEAVSKNMWNNAMNVSNSQTESFTYGNTMLTLSPCLVLVSDLGIYGRAGAVLGFPHYTYKDQYVSTPSVATLKSLTKEYSGGMALGYTVSMGYAFGVGGVKLYVEGDFINLAWAPVRSEITEYMQNGVDGLSKLSLYERKTRYEEAFTYNDNSRFDPNSEKVSMKKTYPYSSVGLKAGILIGF